MTTDDDELLARFHRRLSGIEALVKDPPPWPTRVRASTRFAGGGRSLTPAVGVVGIVILLVAVRLLTSASPSGRVGASGQLPAASGSAANIAVLEVIAARPAAPEPSGVRILPGLFLAAYTARVSEPNGTVVAAGRLVDPHSDPRAAGMLHPIVLRAGTYHVDVIESSRATSVETGAEVTGAPTVTCGVDVRLDPETSTRLQATFVLASCSFDSPDSVSMAPPFPSLTPGTGRFPSASPIATASPDVVTDTFGRFGISHPASWSLVAGPIVADPFGVPIFYVSTEAVIVGPCFTPNPSGEHKGCADPLRGRHLTPNGILITATPNAGVMEAIPPRVNDIVPIDTGCRSMGADEEKEVVVNATVLIACLRGPDLAGLEVGFAAVVSSMYASPR